MLPFALRTIWFVLSLAGMLSSLVGLPCFVFAVDNMWMPVTYGTANVTLQLMFCIGIAWKLDVFLMPSSFCVAQVALVAIAWFITTSLCAAMSIATSLAILRAHGTRILTVPEIRRALRWHPASATLVFGYPVLSFTAFIAVAIELRAVQPFDGMMCDASTPTWVRLLSFAGVPLILAVPSFCLTSTCIYCLLSSRQRSHDHSGSPRGNTLDIFTSAPGRRGSREKGHSLQPADGLLETLELKVLPSLESQAVLDPHSRTASATPTPSITVYAIPSPPRSLSADTAFTFAGRAPTTSSAPNGNRFHLPFSWKPPSSGSSPESERERQDRVSLVSPSPSPMMFAPPSTVASARTSPVSHPKFPSFGRRASSMPGYGPEERDALRTETPVFLSGYEGIDIDSASGSLQWARDSEVSSVSHKSELEFAGEGSEDDDFRVDTVPDPDSPHTPPPAHSSPVVWRILLFQLLLSSTQILATISSLVDMFHGRSTPAPFGTQHVALLLMAWAPALTFGVLPWLRKAR